MGRAPFFWLSYAARLRLAFVFAVGMAACKPEIGDHCAVSTDCSQTGDRLCDIAQPGGYCTIFNCEPQGSNAATKCPDEAACIAFGSSESPVLGCDDELGSSPYSRSFCMKKCKNTNDCRSGYVCKDLALDSRFEAVDVDGATKVCTVDFSPPAPVLDEENGGSSDLASGVSIGVCTGTSYGSDAGLPPAEGNAGASSGSGTADNAGATASLGNAGSSGASGSEGN